MTNLTEQWKKGELETGDYYVKPRNGQVFVYHINHSVKHIYHNHAGEIKEVLAPVPSYEEWQELKEFADYSLHNRDELTRQINFWMDKHTQVEKENAQLRKFLEEFNALDVAEENQKLKELLLDCSEFLYEILDGTHSKLSFKLESGIRKKDYMMSLSELKTKIDNAIGEKECFRQYMTSWQLFITKWN